MPLESVLKHDLMPQTFQWSNLRLRSLETKPVAAV